MRNLDGIISLEYIYRFNKIRDLGNGFFNSRRSRPILFSRGKIAKSFYTEDSKLYITSREQKLANKGIKFNQAAGKWDSLSLRIVREYQIYKRGGASWEHLGNWENLRNLRNWSYQKDWLLGKFGEYREKIYERSRNFASQWSLAQLWNFSLIGAILLGMVSMTLIYKFLGPGASAGDVIVKNGSSESQEINVASSQVLGAATENFTGNAGEASEYIEKIILNWEDPQRNDLEEEIQKMVKGYPIEKMVPYILEKDKIVAAFLIGIAKKESDWGKHVPVLQGQDCYNYWGYRGQRRLMGTGGHTCFNSRKDAVDTVAKRIEFLVSNNKLNTPAKMVIWKCGSDCEATGGHEAARKWISDVETYFEKLND